MNITQQLWSAKEWARVQATGSDLVQLVHRATNEDKWGPTGQQMEEICGAFPQGSTEIMDELRWRLKNRDKSWRACYKSLLVLDYLARNVSDGYLTEICSLVPTLRTIAQSFYYTNPKGVDHGVSVRERAKNLAELMSDGLLLREERAKALQTKRKLAHNAAEGGGPAMYGGEAYHRSSYDRYGGYGNGDRYSGGGSSPSTNSFRNYSGGRAGNYDPYRSPNSRYPASMSPGVPRSREEQERLDLEYALRIQREEERRSGISSTEVEAMYEREARRRNETARPTPPPHSQPTRETDEELAMRLQREEEGRARREGRSLPTLRSDRDDAASAARSSQNKDNTPPPPNNAAGMANKSMLVAADAPATAPTKPPQAENKNVLDDLFAPSAPPAPTAVKADPFDAFLDSRAQQQQQQQQQQPFNAFAGPMPGPTSAVGGNPWSGNMPISTAPPAMAPPSATAPWMQAAAPANTWETARGAPQGNTGGFPSANVWGGPAMGTAPPSQSLGSSMMGQSMPPATNNNNFNNNNNNNGNMGGDQFFAPPGQTGGHAPSNFTAPPPSSQPTMGAANTFGDMFGGTAQQDPWGRQQTTAQGSNTAAQAAAPQHGADPMANMWASLDQFATKRQNPGH